MNYYILLGVSDTASEEEIKSAYRNKAKVLHPDHSGQDCKPFQELQEAYSTLSDPQRKLIYDRDLRCKKKIKSEPLYSDKSTAHRRRSPVEPIEYSSFLHENISLRNSYETFFPGVEEIFDRIWRNFTDIGIPKSEPPEELQIDVPISYADAQKGGQIRLLIPVQYNCPVCRGSRNIGEYVCVRCSGQGSIRGDMALIVRIPAGIQHDVALNYSVEDSGIKNFYLTLRIRITG